MEPFYIDKEDLRHKFIDLRMTRQAIADEYGCSLQSVKRRLYKYDITLLGKHSVEYKMERSGKPTEYYQLPCGEPQEGREIDGRLIGLGGPYAWHICQDCGVGRWVESRWLRENVYKGKCLPCIQLSGQFRGNLSNGMTLRYCDPNEREKTSEDSKKMWASDPIRKERHAEFLRWVAINPDVCKKKSDWSRAYWDDPKLGEYRREKMGEHRSRMNTVMWAKPGSRERQSMMAKSMYATPERKDKQVKAMRQGAQIKPTKPEMQVEKILHELFPNQWKYVGDGEIIFGGKNPDFVNIKGKKQIIEMFGTYYHSKAHNGKCPLLHMLERKDGYAKFGQDTLIVWQHELENENAVRVKISEFCNSKHIEKV